ncbi:MAG: EamA family transporter [Synechococcaceae cyanobacterium]|nr:EamA family transporter [Synechococcaceae cyanobacterium]
MAAPASAGLGAGLLSAVLFGCSAPLIGVLSGAASPLAVASLLYGGASLALLLVRRCRPGRADETPVLRRDMPALLALTLLGGIVGPLCLVMGLNLLSGAAASLLLNLEAVFTMLIAVAVGREHLGGRGVGAAALIVAGAVVLSEGSLRGATPQGALLIAAATLAWGLDNNLSQRLSLRDPLQIALLKSLGASLPMLLLAIGLDQPFPPFPSIAALLLIGALGYGISIWLDLLALRALGAAREAVVFSIAPFVGALFAVAVLREPLTATLLVAAPLMAAGLVLLQHEDHAHLHRHQEMWHSHRHFHAPHGGGDPHHRHPHSAEDLAGIDPTRPFWHAHEHHHLPMEHAHPHVSDAHHRHRH